MIRNILVCLGFAIAFTAASGELRAEPVCEPELRPELCVPGISTNPECWLGDPAGAPSAGGMILLAAPERVVPVSATAPAPSASLLRFERGAIGAARPGYERRIDRPPQRAS